MSQLSQALREAEEQWHKKYKNQLDEQSSGAQRVEELQEEVASLHIQLEQAKREQAALLKAEVESQCWPVGGGDVGDRRRAQQHNAAAGSGKVMPTSNGRTAAIRHSVP